MNPRSHTPHIKQADAPRRWFLLDANGVVLGRLAALAAHLLRGKGSAYYSPHMDVGHNVVVVNAGKVKLTGNKLVQKIDFRASRYPGGQVYTHYGKLIQEKPDRAGMLPKNRLRDRFIKRLKVTRGDEGRKTFPGAEVVDLKSGNLRMGGPFIPSAQAPEKKKAVAETKG
jgi:large subunit ribosomal protein L13